ncbi:hypothetical protein XaplCFBP3123_11040 [Xanthomonas arboricola pv. populi]|nr:hypothetical protein XaplCFBP3123_11040 [Xanthomonas arboricola pv. populi]
MRRVPRWWAGKGPAAKPQINRSATDPSALDNSARDRTHNSNQDSAQQRRLGAVKCQIKSSVSRVRGALTTCINAAGRDSHRALLHSDSPPIRSSGQQQRNPLLPP